MSGIATAIAVTGVAGAVASNAASKRAIQAQKDAAAASQVDIDALNEKTRAISRQNAIDSAELERQLTPEVSQFRTNSINKLNSGLNDNAISGLRNQLQGSSGAVTSPLLQAAIQKAYQDLQLGGQLGIDQQNLVTRQALQNAGTVGGGLGLGRDLVARDLGLTSLALEQARLNAAAQLGGADVSLGQFNAQNELNRAQLIAQLTGQQFGQNLSAASFGQGIAQPIVGLDPSAIANISIGNSNGQSQAMANQANIRAQQANNYLQFAGQALGAGLSAYGASRTPTATTSGSVSPSAGTFNYFQPQAGTQTGFAGGNLSIYGR